MSSLHADEAFLEHYQFSHDPFAARVPGFRFFPAQRKPVLGQLHHLTRYSQLLLVVTGPQGSGKTLLRQALVASTNKQSVHSIVLSASGAGDVAGVLRQVAQGLGQQQTDMGSILAQIAQMALTGQEVYLLVDDAEQLADAALEVLFTLAAGNADGRAHVFLFAESDILPRLEQFADGEERFHAIELMPYDEDETREYLALRLDGAGQGIDLLSDEQIGEIHQGSAGWPGSINQVARDVLVEAMLASRAGGTRKAVVGLPKKHLLALAVVAVALIAAWLMQGRTENRPPVVETPVELIPQSSSQSVAASSSTPVDNASTDNSQALPLPLEKETQPVIREPLAQASGMDEAGEGETDVQVPLPAPVVPVVAPAPVAPAPKPAEPIAKPAAPKSAVSKPVAPAPVKVPAVTKPPVKKPAPAKTVSQSASVPGAAWYAGRPAGNYVLQILGTRSEGSAKRFVSRNGAEYHYFKKLHQGQPLYVVTYGQFSSRAAALAALKALPASVQAGKPWPRSFASIQQEMMH